MRTIHALAGAMILAAGMLEGASRARIPADNRLDLQLQQAIRRGDSDALRVLLHQGASAAATDGEGTPALINTAIYGTAAHMKMLLDAGAPVDQRDRAGATALIISAADPEKARLLLERGASATAKSALGRTPLMVAAAAAGGAPIVRELLVKGARPDERDDVPGFTPTGGGKATALIDAGRVGDLASVKMLVAAGADVNARGHTGATVLSEAAFHGRRDIVRFVLASGADAKTMYGPFTVLMLAAMRGDAEVARMLLAAGVPVMAVGPGGMTALDWAHQSDHPNAELIAVLEQAGLRREKKSAPVAFERNEPKPVEGTKEVGAPLELLAKAAAKKTGCVTCHNHTLPLQAFVLARKRGVWTNEAAEADALKPIYGMMKPAVEPMLQGSATLPDLPVTGAYVLEALAAAGHAPDRLTAAIVHGIAQQQMADGRMAGWAPRQPLESGDIQATAGAIRAMKLYGMPGRRAEWQRRIAAAAGFLRRTPAHTTEDAVMRMLGLIWADAPAAETQAAVRAVMALQRPGGGWGQTPALAPDAYATGKAMYALAQFGGLPVDSPAYRNGVSFLESTREADGSWHVKTRAFPFQPLVSNGFPHGRDEWISSAGTSWAAMALLLAN